MAEGVEIKSVWGKNIVVKPNECEIPIVSFNEIMAEQFQEETIVYGEQELDGFVKIDTILDESNVEVDCSRDYQLALELSNDPDCSSDIDLALKLQREFDREMELQEKFEQSKKENGVAKATIASDPYYYLREEKGDSSDEEDNDDIREFAINLLYERKRQVFPACGFIKTDEGKIITKYDKEINYRNNCDKALLLPLELSTGDVIGGRLSDRVFNDLRTCRKAESRKQVRVKDKEEQAANTTSVDALTRLIFYKWINAGEFDRIEGEIAKGKESTVFHAVSDFFKPEQASTSELEKETSASTLMEDLKEEEDPQADKIVPLNSNINTSKNSTHFAIKVFKTTLTGFRNRAEYVKDDFRFKNPRRVMKVWAEKEFMNLQRLKRANLPCPTPICLRKHVLLMSFIGDENAAKKLKEVEWVDSDSKINAFLQVKDIIFRMYNDCSLVHGDFSEFNLLYHKGQVYVIDVAQAMDLSHPQALILLCRDIDNILEYFLRIGTENLPTHHEFFHQITGINFNPDKGLFSQVESFERENRNMSMRRAKARPADLELSLYQAECSNRSTSPTRFYN